MKCKNCIVIFNNSWGEVDFILPVIKNLNERNYKIFSSIKSSEFYKKKKNYLDLFQILNSLSIILDISKNPNNKSNIFKVLIRYIFRPKYLYQKLKNFNFSNINKYTHNIKSTNFEKHIDYIISNKIKIDFILCADFDSDYYIWIKKFPKTKFFLFPHAITLRGNNLNKFRNVDNKIFEQYFKFREYQLSKFPKGTRLFSCNNDELNYFKYFAPKNIKLKVLGIPRLSKKWINYLHGSLDNNLKKFFTKKNLLLVIGKSTYLGNLEIEKKIISVIKLAEKYKYNIIIKNHPRNKLKIKKFINFSKKISINESPYSISSTLKYCDIVILTSKTGVCLESVFQNKVVIEYYKYGRSNLKNKVYEYKINNELYSIYKYKNLAYSCEDNLSLHDFFYKINCNAKFKKKILKLQKKSLKKQIPFLDFNKKYEKFIC